ncbi:MAG: hypothetical protein AAFQ85_06645 [Pseudomonadota bacterium]
MNIGETGVPKVFEHLPRHMEDLGHRAQVFHKLTKLIFDFATADGFATEITGAGLAQIIRIALARAAL